MIKQFCNWLLFKKLGWKLNVTVEHPDKFVIALAQGMKINFLMKKEWFSWPFGVLFRRMGGIPVNRSKHTSMTDAMAHEANVRNSFKICITPEGTRSPNAEWKKGFYYIALKAKIQILLYGLDYERKLIQCTKSIVPTGDFDSEMKEIKTYFKTFKGKNPENFIVGN